MAAEFDWETPLGLLREAFQRLQGAPRSDGTFYDYVDVGSGLEALEQIIDDVEWETVHAGR